MNPDPMNEIPKIGTRRKTYFSSCLYINAEPNGRTKTLWYHHGESILGHHLANFLIVLCY